MGDYEYRKAEDAGGRTVVHVEAGRGDDLRQHLADAGIEATVFPAESCERLEVHGDMDRRAVQAVVDRWPG